METLGQYLNFKDEDYPIALNFNGFYYYEGTNHNHILLHLETRQKSVNFHKSKKVNLLNQINQLFGLSLTKITIYDPNGVYLYSATPNSESLWGDGIGSMVIYLTIDIDYDILSEAMSMGEEKPYSKEEVVRYVKSWNKSDFAPGTPEITHPARPPTD